MRRTVVALRGLANLTGIASYVVKVNGFLIPGIVLNLTAQGLMAPWIFKTKAWDMLATGAFFAAINLHPLLS